ncbi:protease FtsH subunit HflC [Sulfurivirga caldicuralii]|uniref:Protein HflC n=1 Tax=Sulfurivirga caldicuralii TaxID=364032 RepID=A0A1N6F1G7_9GAMM|nr:protease modulator HflC [Sulfurivirga caldicuralii]SIN89081.1 protease FtsH subunit HflC [Sulfurivirga caldicuralii]
MKNILGFLLAAVLFIAANAFFVINEGETGIVFRLGEIVKADLKPGLHVKTPFVNNVRTFDARLQTLDAPPERYLTVEKKNLIVDSFAKWRIADSAKFYTTMGGDIRLTNMRLSQILKDGLRAEFGSRTVKEVIASQRDAIIAAITKKARRDAQAFGIEVVDVRIKRVDLPRDVSESVYRRMEAERKRVANELRSEGAEAAEKIRADADRQRVVLLAEAYRKAETIRGEGDGKASEIYAKAYSQDPDFFAFFKSLQSYQAAFDSKKDILVLDPRSEYFRYLMRKDGVSATK